MTTAWVQSLSQVVSDQLFAGENIVLHLPCCLPCSQPTPSQLLQVMDAICCFYMGLQVLPYPLLPAGNRKHPLAFPSGKDSFKRKQQQHPVYLQLNGGWPCVSGSGAARISVLGVPRTSLGSGSGVTDGMQFQSSTTESISSYPTSKHK